MISRFLIVATALSILFSQQSCKEVSNDAPIKEPLKKEVTQEKKTTKKSILFFGNSITAAFGLEPNEAFSNLIQEKIDSLGLDYTCINAGNSGETTKGGLARLDWVMKEPIDIFVLELGANDGLRGYSTSETKKNLIAIIRKFKNKNPSSEVILTGMKVPPSMGDKYFLDFENMYSEIAQVEKVNLIPFLLENVAGMKDLNLPDGIHPTAEGHKIVTEIVWKTLYPLLDSDF